MPELPLSVDGNQRHAWGTYLQRGAKAQIPEDFKGDDGRRRRLLGRCCFLYALRLRGTSRLALLLRRDAPPALHRSQQCLDSAVTSPPQPLLDAAHQV